MECDRVGRSFAASLFKEIADSQAIQGTLKGYRRNYGKSNPAYKRLPFKAQWLTIADRHIHKYFQARNVSVKIAGDAKSEVIQMHTYRLRLAFRMGFFCLLRRSEFLPGAKGVQPAISWNPITFSNAQKRILSWYEVLEGNQEVAYIQVRVFWSKTDLDGNSKGSSDRSDGGKEYENMPDSRISKIPENRGKDGFYSQSEPVRVCFEISFRQHSIAGLDY